MKVFVGMETSGTVRDAFAALGHDAISCDLLPAQKPSNRHMVGDVFEVLAWLDKCFNWRPDLAVFHPTCTFLTLSAAWAFKDPDFIKYPGVGYHMRLKPGTLTGHARRVARQEQIAHVDRLWRLPIKKKVIENPKGFLSTMWRRETQILQPYNFGEDASKQTCLWIDGLPPLKNTSYFPPRIVNGLPRWSNQTDNGQNKLGPSEDRWQVRSDTFPGIANAFAQQWGIETCSDLFSSAYY